MIRLRCVSSCQLFVLASLAAHAWAGDMPAAPALTRSYLRVSASESVFANVNQSDAVASMKVWSEQLGKLRGFQLDARVGIAQSMAQMRQSLKERMVDLLVLDTPDYLTLAETNLLDAVFAGTNRGQLAAYSYLLLIDDPSGGLPLSALRGKKAVVCSRTKSNLGLVWVETLLAENRLGRAASFFGGLDNIYRSSQCVMPLFFHRIEACVVDSGNWEAMKELNPQLGRLRVIARSESFLEGVVAMPVQPHPHQAELVSSLLNMHRTPAGEQLGIVFKIGPLVRVSKAQFESVRVLREKYHRMIETSAIGTASPVGRPDGGLGKGRP
ncbi:MAG: PhnD/SsuA/transferrin family substrate-binding protein [Acidobacteria bacterium]|nr:PhnD/SsuA/transferrin family substrate-binding protein [Acidobacteriota bacterium]